MREEIQSRAKRLNPSQASGGAVRGLHNPPKAIATSSCSVATAQGYEDGEKLSLDSMLGLVERIVRQVNLPVTVDFEGGYAAEPDELAANVLRLLSLGVVGLNIEDQVLGGPGLYSIDEQVPRLRAAREAAESIGVPAFLNARCDLFLKADPDTDHSEFVDEAIQRAAAYAAAGADGFFVPGLSDRTLVARICHKVGLPINVMAGADPDRIADLASHGVSRISFGPHSYLGFQEKLQRDAAAFY